MKKFVLTTVLATALVIAGGTSASAITPSDALTPASTQSECSGSRTVYQSTKDGGVFTQAAQSNSSVSGQGGITIGISTSTTFTVGGSFTTTAGVSASTIVATVKADFAVTVQASRSSTTSNSGSWTVPESWGSGRLAIGTMKYRGTVTKYLENRNCQLVQQDQGSYNAPQAEWFFTKARTS